MGIFIKKLGEFLTYKRVFWCAFFIFIFFLILNNSLNYLDPDLGWHLKAGQDIWKEKKVPDLNYSNYTLEGKSWVDHEWLMNLVSYLIYSKAGNISLNIFFAFLVLALVWIILIDLNRKLNQAPGTDPIHSGGMAVTSKNQDRPGYVLLTVFFLIIGLLGTSPHLGVRMQEIGLVCLALLYFILETFNRKRNLKTLLWLLPLFYFWSSAHASFLIGFFILFFWFAVNFASGWLAKIPTNYRFAGIMDFFWLEKPLAKKETRGFLAMALLAFLTSLLTPYGLKLYEFLWDYKNTFYMTHISEWLPAWYYPIAYWQLFYLALVFAGLILFFLGIHSKENKIKTWDFLLIIFFAGLAIKSKRHFPLFFVSSFAFTVKNYINILDLKPKSAANSSFFEHTPIYVKFFLITTMLLVSAGLGARSSYASDPFKQFCADYPCGALNFLKNHPEYSQLRLFNNYAWGGYLIWTYPEKKLFIDGRMPQVYFNGHSFLEEYFDFYKKENLPAKLELYDIKMILLKSRETKNSYNWFEKVFFNLGVNNDNNSNALIDYLKSSKQWENTYEDPTAIIFIKE